MSPKTKRFSILMLEDNPLDAELAEQHLRRAGYNFDSVIADSRAQFEALFAGRSFDLILADYSLPDFDGLSALDIVRATNKRLPFIFVSGVLGEDVAVETLLRGATDYVLKQKLDRLVPAVNRALVEHWDFLSRERAERDLRKVEEKFEKLTNSLPAMVWTCDSTGRLKFVNALWKLSVDAKAEYWFDNTAIHSADGPICRQIWSEAQASLEPFEIDCRYWNIQDQVYRWHIVHGTPLSKDESPVEWVGTCTDIERQRMRDAELKTAERLALAGRMASVVAHEINNPLEALTNIVYLVRSEHTPQEQIPALLSDAQHELVRISAITRQTLQWSRDEGKIVDVSAHLLVEEALKLFTAKMRNKDIEVDQDLDVDVTIRAIPGEMRQVLANLLSNAIDAVEAHGRVRVSVRKGNPATPFAEIEIEDNGHGIEPGRIAELFRPFHSTKGNLGTGLGLYVSKNILDHLGGDLKVHSTPQVGTRMTIYIPRATQADGISADSQE